MGIYLLPSLALTDENSTAAKEKPVLIDLETQKTYQPEERAMGVSVQQAVSIMVEAGEKNYLLPIYFHGFPSLNREKKKKRG